MAGMPLALSMHAPEGLTVRRHLLEVQRIRVDPGLWGLGRLAKEDDVVDAASVDVLPTSPLLTAPHASRGCLSPDPPSRVL